MSRRQVLGLIVPLLLAGCDDDPAPGRDTSDPAEVDTVHSDADTQTDDDSGPDTTADDTTQVPVDAAVDTVHTWPEVTFGEPLPVAADFDEGYVGVGDLVATTLRETLRPRRGFASYLGEEGELLAPLSDVGRLEQQPGEPHALRHQLALPTALTDELAGWTVGALPAGTRSPFYSLVLADPQLVDQDSPALVAKNSAVTFGGFDLPAYRAHGEYVPQLVDALIRAANMYSSPRPYDVALVCGDLVENSHQNELTWLHTLLGGGVVLPDSGARDDVVPGPANDAFDPFVAEGLAPGTPWIPAVGNHDLLINGNFPPGLITALHEDESLLDALTSLTEPLGLTIPGDPTGSEHPAWFPHTERAAFRVDPHAFHPLQLPTADELLALEPATVPADPTRAALGTCGFVRAHRALPGLPEGHGFTAQNAEDCTGWFSYDPVPGLALRVVSLMLGPVEGGPYGILGRPVKDGALDLTRAGDPRWDQVAFIEDQLARAEADGVALLFISHQRSSDLRTDAFLRSLLPLFSDTPELQALIEREVPPPADALSPEDFRRLLAGSPNVIGHLAGHTHANGILAICPDGTARGPADDPCEAGPDGETGYWEITTAGGVGFPHQLRFLEIVHGGSGLAAFYTSVLDPRLPAGSFAERGLFVSLAARQMGEGPWGGPLGHRLDRNVLLPFALPPAVAASWADFDAPDTIVSETTLYDTRPALPPLPVRP